jgi:Flp pilus assembly protein TadG
MKTVRCFKSDNRGATATIFGLTLIPVLALLGAALDYSRASAALAHMQKALDAAALALVRDAETLGDGQLRARAQSVFDSAFGTDTSIVTTPLTVTRVGKTVRVEATGTVRTAFMRIAGFDHMAIGGAAVAAWGRKKIELALVLDNTGSMASSNKLNELKKASYDLLDKLEMLARAAKDPKDPEDKDPIKVSIVPFNTKVNVGRGHKDASWITYRPNAPDPALRMSRHDWQGCVTDREQTQDLDTRANGHIEADPSTLHLATICGEYFGGRLDRQELAEIRPLTSNFAALRQTIGAMKAEGCTNITIGAAWGLDTLSNNGPFTGAAAYGTADVEKIMILLSDGNNTRSRAYRNTDHCSEGTYIGTQIDQRTRKVCDAIKAQTDGQRIRLYTIRVIEGNATLLSECASTGEDGKPLYYDVRDASGIHRVFEDILKEILATRLTH